MGLFSSDRVINHTSRAHADHIKADEFAEKLRSDVFMQNYAGQDGECNQTPWEVVMEYVIHLERRVAELESMRPKGDG